MLTVDRAPKNPHLFSMKSTGIIAASLTLISIPLLCRGVAFANDPALARAIADLRASDTEWRQERDLFKEQRKAKTIDRVEAEEYAEFVASLQRQKLENCEEVRKLGGNTALEGTDCIILTTRESMRIQETVPSEPPPTEMEEASSLDDQLKALEAELDKELAKKEKNWKIKKIRARFVCSLSLCYLNKKIACVTGKVEGIISNKPKGKNGFGYDPIFIPLRKRKTFAQMKPSDKYKIDHRYRAFNRIKKFL